MKVIELKGAETLKIRKTALSRKYNSETEGFKGKSYNVYSFREKAFVVHEDDQFNIDFASGKVYSIELGESEEGLSLLNHTNTAQMINVARTEATLKFLASEDYKPVAVTNPEELV